MAAFRPVFSVRVPRLGPLVDFVLAGCSCGSLDLNSAVCPPRLKFVSSGAGRKFAHASLRVRMTAFKLRIAAGHPDAVLGFWALPVRARRRLNSRNHAGGYPLSRPEAFKFLFAALCKRARAAVAQRRRALVDISPGGSSKAARGGALARPARRARPGGTARAPWRARRRRRRGNGPQQT